MKLLKDKSSSWYVFIDIFLVYVVFILVLKTKGDLNSEYFNITENHYYHWASGFFLIVFILYFSKLTSSFNFREEFFIPKFKFIFIYKSLILFIRVLVFVYVLFFFIYFIVTNFFSGTDFVSSLLNSSTSFRWKISSKTALFLMSISSFFTGAYEELFCRSFVITKLKQAGFPMLITVFISSLLFAYHHLYYGILGFLQTFIIGLIFAFIYLRYSNVYYVIFIHSFYDIMSGSMIFFGD